MYKKGNLSYMYIWIKTSATAAMAAMQSTEKQQQNKNKNIEKNLSTVFCSIDDIYAAVRPASRVHTGSTSNTFKQSVTLVFRI